MLINLHFFFQITHVDTLKSLFRIQRWSRAQVSKCSVNLFVREHESLGSDSKCLFWMRLKSAIIYSLKTNAEPSHRL